MQKNIFSKNLIDLSALIQNVKTIKTAVKNSLFCAVVKSDAYGHGLCEVANAICKYCDYFAVASVSEGVKLRLSGVKTPILCLLPDTDYQRAEFYGIIVTVQSVNEVKRLNDYCKQNSVFIKFHLAINTGMNRLGINDLGELMQIFDICDACAVGGYGAIFCGAYSHFYNTKSKTQTKKQFKRFLIFQSAIKQKYENAICHISASGGLCKSEKYNLDMVRVGLLMYGYKPVNGTFKLKKVMKTVCDCLIIRKLKRGENLLYGNFKIAKTKKIKIMPFGYFNGLRLGVKGQLNNACMNLVATENFNEILMDDADYTARKNKTVSYNVLTAFGCGSERIYFYGDKDEDNSW